MLAGARGPAVLRLAELERLRGLAFVAGTIVSGQHHGRHPSSGRGASTEFYDHRAYAPGDDAARLDWKLAARSDRLYVRRFQRHSSLDVQVVVDASASMDFAGIDSAPGAVTKWRYAAWLAAATAFVAVRNGDRASLMIAGESGEAGAPPGGGWPHFDRLACALSDARPAGPTVLAEGLLDASRAPGGRRLIVAIGDFLLDVESLRRALAAARARGHAVAVAVVLTRDELDPPPLDADAAVEPESMRRVDIDTDDALVGYRRRLSAHLDALRAAVLGANGRFALTATDADPVPALRALTAPAGP